MTQDTELPDNPLQAVLDELEDRYGERASPQEHETETDWYARMQTEGMLSAWSRDDLKDVRNVQAMRAAEAAGAVVDIQNADYFEPEPVTRFNPETGGREAVPSTSVFKGEEFRALKPEERLAAYREANPNTKQRTVPTGTITK